MAVAAADFYTYARATGTPLPQSKKEEAQLAPAVDKWKKSRLVNKFTESKEDYIQRNDVGLGEAAGLTAALAGIGASVVAARNPNVRRDLANLVRPGKAVSTNVGGIKQDLNVEPVTIKVDDAVTWDDVKQRSTPNYEVVEKGGAGVRSDFTQPVVEKEVKTFSPYDFIVEQKAVDPETAYVAQRLRELQTGPKALESLADEQIDVIRGTVANPQIYPETTSEIRRQNARARAVLTEEADLVRKELLSDQSLNAIDAAEDQETGRVVRQLQRNEDIDQNAVALGEEQFEAQGIKTDPIDAVAESLPDGPPVIQSEQRVGLSKEQDFVEQALAKTRPTYAEELTSEDLNALRGIDTELKQIRSEDQPKFYENRNINLNRISNAPKIKTGTFLDNAVSNLPSVVVAADEIARRGVKDIGDTVKGVKKIVVENAPSNLPDLSRVPTSGTNTSATVQLSDGSAAGPLYPFRQFARGLTGDESLDIIDTSDLQDQLLNTTKTALTQSDLNKMNQVGITGTRIAGPSNVQSIRNNQTLTRQGPVPEIEVPEQTIVKSQIDQRLDKLQQETTELKAISENLGRAGQLMSGGTRAVNTPGTTTFDNAMAGGMVARAGIKPRITNTYYQKNISLPKTMRQAVDTGATDPGRIIDTEPKGSGGRKVTAYNPDYQQLSTIGPYGIERANYPQSITSIAPSASPGSWTPAAGTARNENVNIVISGGRDYTNYPEFAQKTDQIIREMNIPVDKKITIVEGGAKGADKLGERYARERGYGLVVKPADWSKGGTLKYPEYDKSAGPRRNEEMAQMGDVGIAFPGGKGTSNFVKTMAREKGKPVYYASQITEATPNSKEALQVTDTLRKIQTDQNISPEARKVKAQNFLAKIMSDRGVSSASGTFSPLR